MEAHHLPCIAWRCSACGSPPPVGTWSQDPAAGPPSSPRIAGPAGSADPGPGWTGSCSGPIEGHSTSTDMVMDDHVFCSSLSCTLLSLFVGCLKHPTLIF